MKEQLTSKYTKVVSDGVGCLEGDYHICLDPHSTPVHAPRKVPVVLRDRLKETLDELIQQDILATVTHWISVVVIVPKKDGKLTICLNP